MAVALVAPTNVLTGNELPLTGTGWQISSPVTITIDPADIVVVATSDVSGDFDISDVFKWKPQHEGRYTITVDDGTDTESFDVQVYTN